jgi:hypothetical protein
MATYLSKADIEFFFAPPKKVVKETPIVIKQGNGNLTGAIRKTYEDGSTSEWRFVENARTREQVIEAYNKRHG